jgi:hypothetical protein
MPTLAPEVNLVSAGALCLSPMLFHHTLRPMMPYSIVLVAIDAVNGLNDI